MAGFVGARPGRRRLSTFLIVCQRATSIFVRTGSARRRLVARAGAMRSLVRMRQFFIGVLACGPPERWSAGGSQAGLPLLR